MALAEERFEDAKHYFIEGIQSAEEFGRVDELARGQLGLASVYFQTQADLEVALDLVDKSIESFQHQGMQYEIRQSQALQEKLMAAQAQLKRSQK